MEEYCSQGDLDFLIVVIQFKQSMYNPRDIQKMDAVLTCYFYVCSSDINISD